MEGGREIYRMASSESDCEVNDGDCVELEKKEKLKS